MGRVGRLSGVAPVTPMCYASFPLFRLPITCALKGRLFDGGLPQLIKLAQRA